MACGRFEEEATGLSGHNLKEGNVVLILFIVFDVDRLKKSGSFSSLPTCFSSHDYHLFRIIYKHAVKAMGKIESGLTM